MLLLATGCARETDPRPVTTSVSVTPATDGETFTDPEGAYELVVAPEWIAAHGTLAAGIEVWAIEDHGAFASNINVLTQVIPEDMTLQVYLKSSIATAGEIMEDFKLLESGIATGHEGQSLAVMVYEGTPDRRELRFLGVFGVREGEAVVATLSTPRDEFSRLRDHVEPYLMTLRPVP